MPGADRPPDPDRELAAREQHELGTDVPIGGGRSSRTGRRHRPRRVAGPSKTAQHRSLGGGVWTDREMEPLQTSGIVPEVCLSAKPAACAASVHVPPRTISAIAPRIRCHARYRRNGTPHPGQIPVAGIDT